jgi:formamidase
MPREHVIEIDPSKPLVEEQTNGHNRWHEAIEAAAEVDPGDIVVYETRDAFDIQLGPNALSPARSSPNPQAP